MSEGLERAAWVLVVLALLLVVVALVGWVTEAVAEQECLEHGWTSATCVWDLRCWCVQLEGGSTVTCPLEEVTGGN